MQTLASFAQSWQDEYGSALEAFDKTKYQNAAIVAERALSMATSADEKLFTLKLLSAAYGEVGDYRNGLKYSYQEIELCNEQDVPDSVYINSLNNLVNNYLGLEEYSKAIPCQRRMVILGESLYEPDNLEHNQHVSDLGYSYLMTEKYDSAIYLLSKANNHLLIIEGGADDFLMNQLSIGQAYFQKHEFISSLHILQELKDILEENRLDTYLIYAEATESLANAEFSIGKFDASQRNYEISSKRYMLLGFSEKDLEALNQQLAIIYLKNEQPYKSDSVRSYLSGRTSSANLMINQLNLAYKKYNGLDLVEAKQILSKLFIQINNSAASELLFAEAILLNTRINLDLYGQADFDSINASIRVFSEFNKNEKKAEALLLKSKIYKVSRQSTKAINSLTRANQIAQTLEAAHYIKYSILIELLSLHLEIKNLSEANIIYNQILHEGVFEGTEYEDKLAYGYAVFLQVNGYNLESLNILNLVIEDAKYPELLSYQKVLAKVYLDLGQAQKSLSIYNKIEIYLSDIGEHNTIAYGENLIQLGRVSVIRGKYATAESYYVKGIKILDSHSSTSTIVFASAYNSYAMFHQTIGSYNKAKVFYSKAKFYAKDNPELHVDILQNLATLSQYQGEYNAAITLLQEALTAYESIYGSNHPYYATALQNLGNAHNKASNPLKAKDLLEQAINIDKANGLENSITYTNKLHNLAVVLQETDDFFKAREVFTTVLSNRKALLGEYHPDYVYSMYNMAVLMQRMNENEKAKEYFTEVIRKYDFQIKSFFPYLSEEEKSKYYGKIKEAFTAFTDFAAEYSTIDPSINGDLYNFQLNHKAILLSTSKSMRTAILQSNDNGLIAMFENWVEMKRALAKYYSMSKKEIELAGIVLNKKIEESNALEKKLSLKSELFISNSTEVSKTWQNIQKTLSIDQAAIEIIRIKKNIRNDSIWYAALIVTKEIAMPKLVTFYNGNELENKLFKLYTNSIKFKITDKQSFVNFWEPIDNELKNIKKIYLSSDGIYNKINISSLYNSATNDYILDRIIVQYVTNTQELSEESKPIDIDSSFNMILVGDPDFTKEKENAYQISNLPGTREEVELIDSLTKVNVISSITLLGPAATEENIKKINSPNILHIATHGFFLSDNTGTEDMYSMESNPLMRSGLLLSGSANFFRGDHIIFNNSLDSEDGILTAYEAINLNLTYTDIVILSACETGLGEIKNGEGVYGLRRAIEIAGAKSVLMSLWKVDDNVTKELMVLFYRNIFNGIDKFEALNLAQKKIKEKYHNPYYWGAFILSGI